MINEIMNKRNKHEHAKTKILVPSESEESEKKATVFQTILLMDKLPVKYFASEMSDKERGIKTKQLG